MNVFSCTTISLLLVVSMLSAALAFQQKPIETRVASPATSTTAVNGIFDSIKKSMESGYAGGDDSMYAKIQAEDARKEVIRKQRAEERKKRGFKELKDVKERTYVKLKYDDSDDEPEEPKKKLFGMF